MTEGNICPNDVSGLSEEVLQVLPPHAKGNLRHFLATISLNRLHIALIGNQFVENEVGS